jgi:hypothetical protein
MTLLGLLTARASSTSNTNVTESKSTFVWVVGVEGAGHHALKPLVEMLAQITNHKVMFRGGGDRNFRNQIYYNHYLNNKENLQKYWLKEINKRPGLKANDHTCIVEYTSFPFEHECRHCKPAVIKQDEHYDLEWVYRSLRPLAAKGEVTMKMLYLERDWWSTIAAHDGDLTGNDFDSSFKGHATAMSLFLEHIHNEVGRVNKFAPNANAWGAVKYEWFSHEASGVRCTKLVTSLFEFFEWSFSEEDVRHSCEEIKIMFHAPHMHAKNKDYDFVMALKHEYSDFPWLLDVAENGAAVDLEANKSTDATAASSGAGQRLLR